MTEIGNFIVAHWETLLGVLLMLLATDGIAGYLPDKWVPYIGAVKRIAQILLTRFGKGVPVILAMLMLSGCVGLKYNLEETAAPMAIPPPPGLSSDGARGIRVEGAVLIGATGSISEETNTMTFTDGDNPAGVSLATLAAGAGTDDQTAAEVANTPAGSIAAVTVQNALNELDTEKQAALDSGVNIPYFRTVLIGGGAGALDAIASAGLAEGDIATVTTISGADVVQYFFKYDETGAALTESSPTTILPDDGDGTDGWRLMGATNQNLLNTANVTFATGNFTGANGLTVGTGSANTGAIQMKNATNNNIFTITSGVAGAAIGWTTPTAAPGGADYLLNVDADGTMGYTDPASLGSSAPNNVTPVDTADDNATFYPILVDGATGSQATETDAGISFNPSTNVLTLTGIPVGPATDPTTDNQFARKAYVDSVAAGGGLPTTGGTMTGNILMDDGTGDSPTITFQDATNETAVFNKIDSGFLTITTPAADGVAILTGNLKVGGGSPGQAQDGQDSYVTGMLEVDGMIYADGGVTGNVTGTASVAATGDSATSFFSSGTIEAARLPFDAPGAIGGTTPAAITGTTITGTSFVTSKTSGEASDLGLYEANSTDTHAAGFRGPASITGDGAYRGQFPNARASSANMVLAWTNAAESGTGTAADPYVQATSFVDLDGYQAAEATLTDIADGTITENLVNTDNPWADNEVADALTISGGTVNNSIIGGSTAAAGTFTVLISTTLRTPNATSLPGTCTVGDTYWDTDADTDGSLYVCRATDTWKEVDDDGGAGGMATTDIDTSSELATIVTDETGSTGTPLIVFNQNPTIDDVTLGATGVKITDDGDGAITFLGLSAGADEDLTLNFDDTANEVGVSSSTGVTALNMGSIGLVSTGSILGAINLVTTTDGTESPTAAQMYGTMFIADHATATSDTVYTLPAAAAGMSACFYDNGGGTGGVQIDVDGSDVILLYGAAASAGEAINSPGVAGDGVNGDFICLVAIDVTNWVTMGGSGTWVQETP